MVFRNYVRLFANNIKYAYDFNVWRKEEEKTFLTCSKYAFEDKKSTYFVVRMDLLVVSGALIFAVISRE